MLVIGHRGASRAAPENTPAAFRMADRMGADGVELDVRAGPDGRLVVYHDPLPNDPAQVAGLASLAEALDACGERMLVNVEIKNSDGESGDDPEMAVVESTIAELASRGEFHRWLISSFSWETIGRCRELLASIPTAFLVLEASDEVCRATAAAGHAAIHPWAETLAEEVVERCHAAGLVVNTWTCNDPERLRALVAIGVDGVCTDVPDVALDVLDRGASPAAVSPRWGTRG